MLDSQSEQTAYILMYRDCEGQWVTPYTQLTRDAVWGAARMLASSGQPDIRVLCVDFTDTGIAASVTDHTDEITNRNHRTGYIASGASCGECKGTGRIKEYDISRSVMLYDNCDICGGTGAKSVRVVAA